MKPLPIGIQNIKEIIMGGYVYADKTRYVYELLYDAKYYFLSRPRRFGKSLLLDTINEVFKGDKELFKGLWIYDSGHDFQKHPVIRLDMSKTANENAETLKISLTAILNVQIRAEELDIPEGNPSDMFFRLIEGLHEKYGQRVVVLIDEYDKPILDQLKNLEIAEANREVLRGFYGILKSMDPYLRLTFITGVTKFARTAIFSGLNNLLDITLLDDYANICGITPDDLVTCFGDRIKSLSNHQGFENMKNIHEEILNWYNGYSWDGKSRVINPFSLLCFFRQKRFEGFWYSSGTPGFLIDLVKKNPGVYVDINDSIVTNYTLDSADFNRLNPVSLMFQTGYLTIKSIDNSFTPLVYNLAIPNREVREAFNLHIISGFTESGDDISQHAKIKILSVLRAGNLENMLDILKGLFASIPYNLHVDEEAYYHSIFYAVMTVLGFDMEVEVAVSKGRIDAALEMPDKVYVMEFKYEKSAADVVDEKKRNLYEKALDDGMAQIKSRRYHDKYAGSGKTIYLAAFAFLGRNEIYMRYEVV